MINYLSAAGHAHGVDIDEKIISTARKIYPDVNFKVYNIIEENDNIFNKKFDVIVLYNIIEHLYEAERKKIFSRIRYWRIASKTC